MNSVIKPSDKPSRIILEELEPRRLFSGGIEGLVPSGAEYLTGPIFRDLDAHKSLDEADNETTAQAEQRSREIVFVDAGVENYQQFVDDVKNNTDDNRNIEVVVLDRDKDGIEQISSFLQGQQDVDAVHIISHGSDGSVQLGDTTLNADSLQQNSTQIALWANAFTDSGDILFYGCDLASSSIGQNLINELGALTLTDVAASDDLTGADSQGGDWLLEYNTGKIDTGIALSSSAQQNFEQVLAAPVLDLDSGTAGVDHQTDFIDSAGPVLIADTASLTDVDDDVNSITVTLTNRQENPVTKEILAADGNAGTVSLTVDYDSAAGTLTITDPVPGTATTEDFESVLKTVTYDNTQNNPITTTRVITFIADDGTDTSDVATTYVSVFQIGGGTNAPVATVNTVSTLENTALNFSSADFTFFDGDGDPLTSATIKNLSLPSGTLTYGGTPGTAVSENDILTAAQLDTLVYTPAANANGVTLASFDFAVNDAVDPGVVVAQMSIDVTAVNDAPTATNLSAAETYVEDTALNLTDIVVSDVDSANVTVTLTLSDITAGSLNTATSNTVTSTYIAGTGVWTASGAIADVNSLLAGVTFTPALNYNSNFSIATSVDDGVAAAITGTKVMTGTPVNDAAVIAGDAIGAVTEDAATPTLSDTGTLTISDDDTGEDAFQTTGITASAGALGSLSITTAGVWTYNVANADVQYLKGGETKVETFTVLSIDGTPHDVVVTITGTNDVPTIAGDDLGAVTEDAATPTLSNTGTLTISDDDTGEAVFQTTGISASPGALGNLSITTAGVWNYTVANAAVQYLALGETKVETFTVLSADDTTHDVVVTITGTNDAPTVGVASATNTENDASFTLNLLGTSSDPDTTDVLTVETVALVSGNASGVTNNGNGTFTVNPSAYNALALGETEVISYTYDVVESDDGGTELSRTATTATITITGANDAPTVGVASSTNTENDASFTLNLLGTSSDPDTTDVLTVETVALVSGNASGVTNNGNGTFTVNPSAYNALALGETEVISYTYDVVESDDGGTELSRTATTATITITGANDAPTVGVASSTNTENDASFTLNLLGTSSDPDTTDVLTVETVALVSGNASGVTNNGNGTFTVNPSAYNALALGETEVISYTYDVVESDDGGTELSRTATTATITITGTNDAPTVGAVTGGSSEDDAAFSVDLLGNSSDPDTTDVLTVSNVTLNGGDASGVTLNGTDLDVDPSAYNYLADGESAVISYTYDVVESDDIGTELSRTATTATITITGTNDAPTISDVADFFFAEAIDASAQDLVDNGAVEFRRPRWQ